MSRVDAKCVDFACHLVSLLYKLCRCRDFADLFFAGFDFLRGVLSTDAIRASVELVRKHLVDSVRTLCNAFTLGSALAPPHTEGAAETLQGMRAGINTVLSSNLATCLRDFVMSVLSYKILPKDTTNQVAKVLGPVQSCTLAGLVDITLRSAISVVESSTRLISGEPVSSILLTNDPMAEFISEVQVTSSLQTLTYSGLPVEGRVCRTEYYNSLKTLVESGEALLAVTPRRHPQYVAVNTSLARVRTLKAAFATRMSAESRPMPFCLALTGMPGIGKGTLLEFVAGLWSHTKGRKYAPNQVYHRQALEEYWSGYEPLSHPIIHYSEPGSLHAGIAKTRGDPVMTEFLSVADTQPYMCNMADVESKGNVFAMPEMCMMDCNDPTMNLPYIVNNPAAVRRRLLYVEPAVKAEFRKEDTCRLDVAKSLASETPVLDRWTFTVYKMEPVDTKKSMRINLLTDADIYKFAAFLKESFTTHMQEQDARQDLADAIDVSDYLREPATESLVDDVANIDVDDVVAYTSEVAEQAAAEANLKWLIWKTQIKISFMEWKIWFQECRRKFAYQRSLVYYSIELFFRFLLELLCVLGLYLLYPVIYFSGKNFLLQFWSCRTLSCRIDHRWQFVSVRWGLLKSSCGFEHKPSLVQPAPYQVHMYVAALGATLLVYRALTSVSIFAEGNVVQSSNTRTEEVVDEIISGTEEVTGCALPPPRRKAGNAVEWDVGLRKPNLIHHMKQKNNPEEIRRTIEFNVRYLEVTCANGTIVNCRALGVKGDYAVVTKHCFPSFDGFEKKWSVTSQHSLRVKTGVSRCYVREENFTQVSGDIFVVRLRGSKFRDIEPYFANEFCVPPPYGGRALMDGSSVLAKKVRSFTAKDPFQNVTVVNPLSYSYPEHARGLCGAPLLYESGAGWSIVGLHIAGCDEDDGFCETFHLKQVKDALKQQRQSLILEVNSEGYLRLPCAITGLTSLGERSPLRFEDVTSLVVFGGLEGYRAMKLGKSQLRSSPFLSDAEDLVGVSPFREDGRPHYAAPPFSHRTFDGKYVAPYNHFVKKTAVLKKSLDPCRVEKVISYLRAHIVSNLAAVGITSLSPVPLDVAVNGHPEDFYMRAMKPSTSGGWPWPGAKRKWMEATALEWKPEAYTLLFDIKEQVMEQVTAYAHEHDACPLLGAQLKDEPRALEKVLQAKTRVFCMSPTESTVVNRMYLLPFYTLMCEHGEIFGTSIGINMHSTDVDEFVETLSGFSDKFMEGDYGGYDTSMPYDIGLAANSIVYHVLSDLGYNEAALLQVKGILSDNLFPVIAMRGDMFAAPALQPSGKYATAEDNSLRGLVMLVYAWMSMCEEYERDWDFFQYVLPRIYGDDMLAAVKSEAQQMYNNVTYQHFCKVVYGLEFTNAQKTSTMSPFLTLDQISFLKRTFMYREDLGHWVAPLELTSVMKTICYYLPSKQVTRDEQLIDSCVSAMRELFFHLSEEEFEIRRQKFALACARVFERSLSDVLKVFPRFDAIETQAYGTQEWGDSETHPDPPGIASKMRDE
jgi:energy-coupling factor transporter ATP-binding protein EcfA2